MEFFYKPDSAYKRREKRLEIQQRIERIDDRLDFTRMGISSLSYRHDLMEERKELTRMLSRLNEEEN